MSELVPVGQGVDYNPDVAHAARVRFKTNDTRAACYYEM